jgi:hypothetical protein
MTAKRKKGMTLAEHDAVLKAEGRYNEMVDRQRQQEEMRQKQAAELMRAEAPLVKELRAAGYTVNSVWDLVNIETPYPMALPILLNHLQRSYPDPVREGIARALAVPDSRFGWAVLTRLYQEEQGARAKDGLAVAIAGAANNEVIRDVINLARDTRHGPSRLLLLSALERSNDPQARAALMDLGTDPELKKEVQAILRRLKQGTG